mmetsp:Transcript_9930/g.31897  ORF Transcript_9930/g.31897 Transcript_9930/m.31897 type:complete len:373 (-) Transcript_9930:1955-3073(-)
MAASSKGADPEETVNLALVGLPPPLAVAPGGAASATCWAQWTALTAAAWGLETTVKRARVASSTLERTQKEASGASLASFDFWSLAKSLVSSPKSMRAQPTPEAADLARASKSPAAASALAAATSFWAALILVLTMRSRSARTAILSKAGMTSSLSRALRKVLMSFSRASRAAGVETSALARPARVSRAVVATARAAAALSRVTATTRRTPLAMPSSTRRANSTASAVLRRCVPPQSSTEWWRQRGSVGAATRSATGAPTEQTRTGSGYCSPFMQRRVSTAMASASGVSTHSTEREAAIWSRTICSTRSSWGGVRGASQAKSKRRRSGSTCEPRWAHLCSPASRLPSRRTSRRAKLRTWVMVWLGAMRARRS